MRLSLILAVGLPTGLIAWFVPWVLVLHLGLLTYFPYEPDGESRYLRLAGPIAGWFGNTWVSQREIPEACKTALVAAEDTRFFLHSGIDVESMQKSHKYNQRKKQKKRGGSTITQQLVKNAFLSRDRSYVRKARELVGAILLDATMSKESQLTWYLNIVEFAPRTYGIQAASQYYFHKDAVALTPSQCIALASILPSPNKWGISLSPKIRSMSMFLQARYRTILSRMILMGLTENKLISLARSRSPFDKPLPTAAIPAIHAPASPTIEAASEFGNDIMNEGIASEDLSEDLSKENSTENSDDNSNENTPGKGNTPSETFPLPPAPPISEPPTASPSANSSASSSKASPTISPVPAETSDTSDSAEPNTSSTQAE